MCVLCTFIFSHLADAYLQSDTNEENWSNQNQQKSNDKQVLYKSTLDKHRTHSKVFLLYDT